MTDFVINPLSVASQFHTSKQVRDAVANIVDCFEHLLPTLGKDLHKIIYDARIEQLQLVSGEDFNASINSLADDKDKSKSSRRLWYLYTRNRAVQADWEPSCDIEITCAKSPDVARGAVSTALLIADSHWLSFSGIPPLQEPNLSVVAPGVQPFNISNSNELASLIKFLPIYEKSDKHKSESYIDAAGDYVSPMTLQNDAAQNLLLVAVQDKDDRIAYHGLSGKFYRFKITRLNIYHGFEIKDNEVAKNIADFLRGQDRR
jgi:hypothetical protein